ncbi:MAG: hypothetical protein JW841_09510 [Deltaproteobacteria bacterium]|nr:hypothetical protein [Deltaproteobacteria bacterium]
MDFITNLPIWALVIFIFVMRIIDVSLGTVRTLAIVNGRIKLAVFLGFIEVLIWISVVSQVIIRIHEHIVVALAFAGGFATGNAVGILFEKKLALGNAVVRIISAGSGEAIVKAIREAGQTATTFAGQGRDGPVTLIYIRCSRRKISEFITLARKLDPQSFCAVERADSWISTGRSAVVNPTGWRAFWKKK